MSVISFIQFTYLFVLFSLKERLIVLKVYKLNDKLQTIQKIYLIRIF